MVHWNYAGVTFDDGGHLMVKIVALIVILISMYLPISKKGYSAVELVCKILIAIVVISVFICGIMMFPPIGEFVSNIVPWNVVDYKPSEIANITTAIGYSGGGVMAISSYSYWVKGKNGYAQFAKLDYKSTSKLYGMDLALAYTFSRSVRSLSSSVQDRSCRRLEMFLNGRRRYPDRSRYAGWTFRPMGKMDLAPWCSSDPV